MDWSAFAGGFAKGVQGSWQAREEEERKMRTAERLEQLRRETSDYEFKRNTEHDAKQVKRSEYDPASNKVIDFNSMGQEVGRRDSAAEAEAYQSNKRKASLDEAEIQSRIDTRNAELGLARSREARESRETDARIKAGFGRSGSGSGGLDAAPDDFDRADALFQRYEKEIEEAISAGRMTRAQAREGAIGAISNARTGQQAQQGFLRFLSAYDRRPKFGDPK